LSFTLANINKLGHEDHIPGQVRDWNEELQITKELPKKTLPERLIRERAMFKVSALFKNLFSLQKIFFYRFTVISSRQQFAVAKLLSMVTSWQSIPAKSPSKTDSQTQNNSLDCLLVEFICTFGITCSSVSVSMSKNITKISVAMPPLMLLRRTIFKAFER